MLGKMIIHGLVAAVLVAGGAGLYAAWAGQPPVFQAEHGEDD